MEDLDRAMSCPTCQKPLVQKTLHGQQIDQCKDCNSMWVDEGELTAILRLIDSARQPPVPVSNAASISLQRQLEMESIDCPACMTEIQPSVYAYDSGIVVHRCKQCRGTWLATATLSEMADYQRGSPKINSLAVEIGGRYQREHHWYSFYMTLRSKKVNGTLGIVYLILAASSGSSELFFHMLFLVLLAWLVIWSNDFLGNQVGMYRGYGDRIITGSMPGIFVALDTFLLLFLPLRLLLSD